jgi:transposase
MRLPTVYAGRLFYMQTKIIKNKQKGCEQKIKIHQCIDKMAEICEVRRNTVSEGLDKWKHDGFSGLEDKPRSGIPSILREQTELF